MCDLLQDNAKLKSDMEKLLRAMEKGTKPAVKAKGKACPSKPHSSAEPEESDTDGEDREEPDAEVSASGSGGEEDLSEAAKRARLRRLCEKKGSGKLNVPEEVHLLWKKEVTRGTSWQNSSKNPDLKRTLLLFLGCSSGNVRLYDRSLVSPQSHFHPGRLCQEGASQQGESCPEIRQNPEGVVYSRRHEEHIAMVKAT